MSTALHEPPQGIRVGRLVKVIARPPKTRTGPPRAEPPAPKSEEVRLLLFLGLGGAACLAVLALAGLALITRDGAALNDAAAAAPAQLAALEVTSDDPSLETAELLPAPALEPQEVELLPQPVEANLQAPPSAFFPEEPPATQVAGLVPADSEPRIGLEKVAPKSACEKFGTKIAFLRNPLDAFRKAKEENKQVFFVHLSGNFEDQEFT
jgi:hypothetical protein